MRFWPRDGGASDSDSGSGANGSVFVTADARGSIGCWDPTRFARTATLKSPSGAALAALSFVPGAGAGSGALVTCGADGVLSLWDTRTPAG